MALQEAASLGARRAETNSRELRYVVECDELEHVILETLDRIRKRDGEKIARGFAIGRRIALPRNNVILLPARFPSQNRGSSDLS
jgi:hypothetical protein